MSCLSRLANRAPVPSPFTRLIAHEIYDGPVSGLIMCDDTGETFVFQLLAWDERQSLRAFCLSPLGHDIAARVIAALETVLPPRWPEWWLNPRSDAERDRTEAVIQEAFDGAEAPKGVVLCRDLLGSFERARLLVSSGEISEFQALNRRVPDVIGMSETDYSVWLEFLGDPATR
jgi:hypothetical protein